MSEVLPCPFCRESMFISEYPAYKGKTQIGCNSCGAKGPAKATRSKAVDAWNVRPQPLQK